MRIVCGAKNIYMTETGYHGTMNATGGQGPASATAFAKYVPRIFADALYDNDLVKTYMYELVDTGTSNTVIGERWGLLDNAIGEKPAFKALKSIIAQMSAPNDSSSHAVTSLDYTLSATGGRALRCPLPADAKTGRELLPPPLAEPQSVG